MDEPTAALFDLDGTLVDTEPRNRAVWTRYLTELGIAPEGILTALMGRRGVDVFAEHPELQAGRSMAEVRARLRELHAQPDLPPVRQLPDAVAFLRQVHAAGAPLGVVTSAVRDGAEEMLEWLGVRGLLDALVTAGDVTVGKPDPQGYLRGAELLGVPPARVVAVEDSPAGVTAVLSAGMTCVAVTTTHAAAELDAADRVVAGLGEVTWPRVRAGGPAPLWRRVTVTAAVGLHARPAARLVEIAATAGGEVTVEPATRGTAVSAKSILSVLTLDVGCGEDIVLRVAGEEDAPLLADLAAAVQDGDAPA